MRETLKSSMFSWLALVSSFSTLLCCTLPIILIFLGFGATLASLTSYMQWWIVLSVYKFWLFLASGLLLIAAYIFHRQSIYSCPIDPVLAKQCKSINRFNQILLTIAMTIWTIGFISAYVLAPLKTWIG